MAKDVVAAETKRMHEHLGYNFDMFKRCQINLNVSSRYAEMRSMRPFDRCLDEVIMQMNSTESLRSWLRYTEKPLPHVSYLLDASGGRGIDTPIDIFDDDPNIHVGYAGGMNPDNVGDKLRQLIEHRSYAEFWIDMESGVRTDDVFDLDKVEKVLRQYTWLTWPQRGGYWSMNHLTESTPKFIQGPDIKNISEIWTIDHVMEKMYEVVYVPKDRIGPNSTELVKH
jgi:hypothetical protein